MVSIEIDNLHRQYGRVTALDGVNLSIEEAEIVGVAGPNGAGKTTLIEMILGLRKPTDGSVSVNGITPTDFGGADRRRLGYMPQHDAVYRDLTARENVDFFARLYGVDERRQAVDAALSFVDLADRADDRVADLSGGMIRRTSLACAVVHDPTMLFLDEPTVGLDPELRARMWDGFRKRRNDGSMVMVSTHYLGEARQCDRVLFLRDGRVLAFDTPTAFLEQTGTQDLEAAFLALLETAEPSERASPTEGTVQP